MAEKRPGKGAAAVTEDAEAMKKRSREVFRRLKKKFGSPKPPLTHDSTEQLAIAVILSAQCTDERVNKVTPALFAEFPDMEALNRAPESRIKELIYSTGFYNAKAANIKKLAALLVKDYGGKIPGDFHILTGMPGIGRKTANVIMAQAFGRAEGIVVDTHVQRLSTRLAFSRKNNPVSIEKDLMEKIPRDLWADFPLLLIFHGRETCAARKPLCGECLLSDLCPSAIRPPVQSRSVR